MSDTTSILPYDPAPKVEPYTQEVVDNVRLKHGSQVRVSVFAGNRMLSDRLQDVASVGGALTVESFIYNRLAYSGGVEWWNPATGERLDKAPTVRFRVRPADVLTGDEECSCSRCQPEGGES